MVKSTSRNVKISRDSQQTKRTSTLPGLDPEARIVAVSLVGFMGAGKTTVGQALAGRLGWRFEDLDDLIQASEGRTIEQIFQQDGEPTFRDLERRVLSETLICLHGTPPLVLALGGGAFMDPKAQDLLRQAQIPAVFLDAPMEELFRRSQQPDVIRPLRRDPDQFRSLYDQRRPAYFKATVCIETLGKDVQSVVQEIIAILQLKPIAGVSE